MTTKKKSVPVHPEDRQQQQLLQWTVDQAIGYVLSTREAVLDWHNEDYEARGAVEKVTVEGGDQ